MKKNGKHRPVTMSGKKVWHVEMRIHRYPGEHYEYTVVASSASVAERKAIAYHRACHNSPGGRVTEASLICTIDA